MANPHPKLENLKPFQPKGDSPMAEAALCVRLSTEIDKAIRDLGSDRTPWLRRVITEAAQGELLNRDEEVKDD
jgi:hypothetical protein